MTANALAGSTRRAESRVTEQSTCTDPPIYDAATTSFEPTLRVRGLGQLVGGHVARARSCTGASHEQL